LFITSLLQIPGQMYGFFGNPAKNKKRIVPKSPAIAEQI
jgi:hypothetical protein